MYKIVTCFNQLAITPLINDILKYCLVGRLHKEIVITLKFSILIRVVF